jgi:glycosyltransferase involved in cell wall biosynthesis
MVAQRDSGSIVSRGRILFLADASHVHTRRWVQAMAERGFECVVATRLSGRIDGAEVIVVRPGSDRSGWFRAVPAVRALAGRVAPHWVHGHYVTSYGFWAAACRGVAPIVLTAWGSDVLVTPRESGLRGRMTRALLRWSLRRADLITADARAVLDEIGCYGVTAPLREVLWGVDTVRFRPADDPGIDDARFELISLRQWEHNYRIDLLLRAFAALRAARPDLRVGLTLLGGGSLAAELQALAAQLALDSATVRFVGRVDETAMILALQGADVSVSVPASDATSVAMLESMACGLPVIASDLPANRSWIDAAQRVPVDDAAALTAALLALANDPAGRRAIGHRNSQAIRARASRAVHMDRMASLYESLRPRSREVAA